MPSCGLLRCQCLHHSCVDKKGLIQATLPSTGQILLTSRYLPPSFTSSLPLSLLPLTPLLPHSLQDLLHQRGEVLFVQLFMGLQEVGLGSHLTPHLARYEIANIHALVLVEGDRFPAGKQLNSCFEYGTSAHTTWYTQWVGPCGRGLVWTTHSFTQLGTQDTLPQISTTSTINAYK